MQSSDANHFFQTDAALQKEDRRYHKSLRSSTLGDPITLPSKIVRLDVRGSDAYTAESGWVARRVDLESGKTKRVYRGHQGPVTCLAFYEGGQGKGEHSNEEGGSNAAQDRRPGKTYIFTGSWDKSIKIFDTDSGLCISTTPNAHNDFVKSLLVIPALDILISGSSDKTMNVWDLSSVSGAAILAQAKAQALAHGHESGQSTPATPGLIASNPLTRLTTVKEHTRPVESMVLESSHVTPTSATCTFFSADSMGVIRRWRITKTNGSDGELKVDIQSLDVLKGHATSVAMMQIAEGGLWTVSMDKTVLFHPLPRSSPPLPPTSISHPDYVKCLLLLPSSFHPSFPLLLTGSTDEDIRVFDVSSILENPGNIGSDGAQEGEGEGVQEKKPVVAHYMEVTGLQPWLRDVDGKKEAWIVSSSLDCTLRRWSMRDIMDPPVLPELKKEEDEAEDEENPMTAEEEAELAELMGDD